MSRTKVSLSLGSPRRRAGSHVNLNLNEAMKPCAVCGGDTSPGHVHAIITSFGRVRPGIFAERRGEPPPRRTREPAEARFCPQPADLIIATGVGRPPVAPSFSPHPCTPPLTSPTAPPAAHKPAGCCQLKELLPTRAGQEQLALRSSDR